MNETELVPMILDLSGILRSVKICAQFQHENVTSGNILVYLQKVKEENSCNYVLNRDEIMQ